MAVDQRFLDRFVAAATKFSEIDLFGQSPPQPPSPSEVETLVNEGVRRIPLVYRQAYAAPLTQVLHDFVVEASQSGETDDLEVFGGPIY
jgi:hypothetical protein